MLGALTMNTAQQQQQQEQQPQDHQGPIPRMTTTNIGNHVGNSGNDEDIDIACGKGVDIKTETYSEDDKRSAERSNESPSLEGNITQITTVIAAVREVVFHLLAKALLALAVLFLLDM